MLVFHRGNGLPVLSGISVPKPVFQVIGSLRFKPSRDNSRIAGLSLTADRRDETWRVRASQMAVILRAREAWFCALLVASNVQMGTFTATHTALTYSKNMKRREH